MRQVGAVKKITIHTDGACLGNPGPGGWAAILEYGNSTRELAGGALATTNNRMEMTAALEALACLREPCEVELITDSEYLRDGITKWIHSWKAKGWKKKVKNKDLWLRLDEAASRHLVNWHWVRGHAGHPQNERCDVLATTAAKRLQERHSPEALAEALADFRQQQHGDEPTLL